MSAANRQVADGHGVRLMAVLTGMAVAGRGEWKPWCMPFDGALVRNRVGLVSTARHRRIGSLGAPPALVLGIRANALYPPGSAGTSIDVGVTGLVWQSTCVR